MKKYHFLKPAKLWKGMLRGTFFRDSKVKHEYAFLLELRRNGVDAAVPIAYGEQRLARWLLRSFLVTEGVPEPTPLDIFICQLLPRLPAREHKRTRHRLLTGLAESMRRFHAKGFVHNDLYWRNIVLSRLSLDRFFLIDAPKGRRCWPWEKQRCRAKDLATLDAPAPLFFRRTERLRFFLYYVGGQRLTPTDKRLLRVILRRAEPERERQFRRVAGKALLVGLHSNTAN